MATGAKSFIALVPGRAGPDETGSGTGFRACGRSGWGSGVGLDPDLEGGRGQGHEPGRAGLAVVVVHGAGVETKAVLFASPEIEISRIV